MYHPVTHGISIEKKTSERENILVILEEFFEMVERWVGSIRVLGAQNYGEERAGDS